MNRYICIHGHFYQPPRENPWLEAVELQDSALPYHDWNERVAAECYAPNAYARFVDGEGRIERIISNYSRISFNFGPTLLAWMKEKAPYLHQAVIDADRESQARFSGHGSAMAQCYNHAILPLANRRDKEAQVLWGKRDFESRFGRPPEGMWLAETAADHESLDVLAQNEIKFTVLCPQQASRVRPLAGGDWRDVAGGRVDPSMPYQVNLPSGRSLAVFFYDGPIAQGVAFEGLLANGEHFARRLLQGFDDSRGHPQLVSVATDGETYGHHNRHGEMALAYALHALESDHQARLTNYAEFLERHPPTHQVDLHQPSSWSCPHGVDRWRKHCGCNSGGHPGWNQQWREPLRQALDGLRDQLAPRFEAKAKTLLKDPWAARNDYINVILDRSPETTTRFLAGHAPAKLSPADQIAAVSLLEMQRHALLMYTSCGWFFDDISGIETVQVIQYAARAIQLARNCLGDDLEPAFLDILGRARSNLRERQDGRRIYEEFVKPAIMTRESAGAHYAISSLFESYPKEARIYSFTVREEDRQLVSAGNARLALGRVNVTFEVTGNADLITYAVIHMGGHNLNCGVRYDGDPADYAQMAKDMRAAFERADFAELIRLMDHQFGETHYSLRNLFRDEQHKVLDQILAATRDEILNTYRLITDRYATLMRFLADLRAPALKPLGLATEFVLNSELRRQFEGENLDLQRVRAILGECQATHVPLDADSLSYALKGHLERLSDLFLKTPETPDLLQRLTDAADLARSLPFEVNLWKPQNTYFGMQTSILPSMGQRAKDGDKNAAAWLQRFRVLGERLGFRVDPEPKQP